MKPFVRNALLGAAGLVVLALPAHAASTTSVTDTPLFKSTPTADTVQMAQRRDLFGPSSGSVGFKKSKKKKKKK
jgi:hypothetical protein